VPALVDTPPKGGDRWRDLGSRTASAVVLVPLALFCLWMGGWIWTALVAATALGMGYEWLNLCRRRRPAPWLAAAGMVYILPAAAALLVLRAHGVGSVLFVFCIVWASDIGAYMIGRMIGGPKLAPAISPGKTRSGALGGLLAAVGVGLAAARIGGGSMMPAVLAAAALGIVAQGGDLLESALKRHFGVKDSGRLIPGHGGLLDRLDALLLAAPVAAALTALHGQELWR